MVAGKLSRLFVKWGQPFYLRTVPILFFYSIS